MSAYAIEAPHQFSWHGAPGAVAFLVLAACGGGSAGAAPDAGTPSSDAGDASTLADSASPTEGAANDGGPMDASTEGGAWADSSTATDAGTLTGPSAFPVAYALMNPGEPSDECMPDTVDGGVAATSIVLARQDLSSAFCGDGGAVTGDLVDIEIATAQYAAGATPLTEALAPGVYVIGNEGQSDEDLCMLPQDSTAILQLFAPFDAAIGATAIAVTGTVTITVVGPTSIAGSFDVMMASPGDGSDAAAPSPLSGTFATTTCP